MSDLLDNLVNELGERLEPVKPLSHPVLRLLPFFAGVLAYVGAVVAVLGVRGDIAAKLHEGAFLFESGLVLSLSVVAAMAASWLTIPDLRGQKWLLAVPFSLFAVFMFWIGAAAYDEGTHIPDDLYWHSCVTKDLLVGILPAVVMVFFSRAGGTTTHPLLSAAMNILFVGGAGWLALRVVCPNDTIAHTFFYHFMPFIFIGAVLGMLARRLYRW